MSPGGSFPRVRERQRREKKGGRRSPEAEHEKENTKKTEGKEMSFRKGRGERNDHHRGEEVAFQERAKISNIAKIAILQYC